MIKSSTKTRDLEGILIKYFSTLDKMMEDSEKELAAVKEERTKLNIRGITSENLINLLKSYSN